jgi:predicted CXXCH cytochrome family protein
MMILKQTTHSIGCAFTLSAALFAASATAGTILGSPHDFSNTNWSGGEICIVCHTPHNADTTVTDAPLWNHKLSTATYDLYDSSPTFDGVATITQPDGSSKLCLSCHDGTVALDAFGTRPDDGQPTISGRANLGTDLSNDHPISFTYDAALVNVDRGLHYPLSTYVTIGSGDDTRTGTIDALLLYDGKLQCASCHDVHNKFAVDYKLLKVSTDASEICLVCHDK